MKNKLSDLTNHLFMQLERLGDESLTPEQIDQEAKRAEAIVSVSDQIVRSTDIQLKAITILANHGDKMRQHVAPMLGRSSDDKQIEGKAE